MVRRGGQDPRAGLPPGGKIHVKNCATTPTDCPAGTADDGKWVFPVGTVMVKTFGFDGKLVETRLFVNHDANTWVGYSYAWDEAQTEATIVPDSRVQTMFNTGSRTVTWNYPSRMDCMTCHKPTGGSTLGLETAQLNRDVGGGMNQLDQLQALGLFDAPVPTPYKTALVTPYASQAGTPPAGATSTQRARSYLHANCAFCHRPDDPDISSLDLRYDTDLADTFACRVSATKSDLGYTTAFLLDPGNPMNSLIWLRMQAPPDTDTMTGLGQMPPMASYVIDQNALDVIGQWITSIASCPDPT